jgi:ABC-type transport system involved in multi-copper enzyme maturation permease subunit
VKLLAVIEDGFREAKDRKISTVLFLLSFLVAGVCASFTFESDPDAAARAADFALRSSLLARSHAPKPGETGTFDNWRVESQTTRAVIVRFPAAPPSPHDLDLAERALRRNGFCVERRGEAIEARVDDPLALPGGKLHLFFGAATFELGPLSAKQFARTLELVLATAIAGWVGVIVAILLTSGFVPSMLQSGSIHLLLAKPVRRPTLLLGKYLGGIVFFLAHAALLVGLSSLALAARLGWWDFRFLLLVPLVAAIFATVHAISVLAGVLFESPMLAALLALGFWGACGSVGQVRSLLEAGELSATSVPAWVKKGIDGLYWVLPKTGDFVEMAQKLVDPGFSGDLPEQIAAILQKNYALSFATTAAFTGAVLALACFFFWRKDY